MKFDLEKYFIPMLAGVCDVISTKTLFERQVYTHTHIHMQHKHMHLFIAPHLHLCVRVVVKGKGCQGAAALCYG